MRRAVLFLALAGACGDDFDPYYRLTALRVLAIAAEPAAPTTGETSTIGALVYTPPGESVTSWQWSWCPFAGPANEGYPCLIDEDDLAALGGGGNVPSFDLGSAETASFESSIDPAILAAVCEGTPGQPSVVDCAGGFPVQLRLGVQSGAAQITAVREFRLRFAPEHEPNANPAIDGLVAVIGGAEQPVGDAPDTTLARGEETVIRTRIAPEVSESYTAIDEDTGQPATVRERLIVSWFVETGDLDDERTTFIDGVTTLDQALENTWEPDLTDEFERDTADLFVVVRDARGGTSWRRGTVALGAAPP